MTRLYGNMYSQIAVTYEALILRGYGVTCGFWRDGTWVQTHPSENVRPFMNAAWSDLRPFSIGPE